MLKRQFRFFILYLTLAAANLQWAQTPREYIIGNGDLLSITFWQRAELNTDARVTAAGTIELPLVGAIQAAGLTPSKLRDNIVSRVALLDIRVTQAAVVVREYASRTVYVTGSVLAPGKKSFEVIPNLWQIILECGGPRPEAQLQDVTIVRGSGVEAGKTIHIDVTEVLERGDFSTLTAVLPGDYINVPGKIEAEAQPLTGSDLQDKVHIFGEVARPGSFELQERMDLFDVIVLAGGPTAAANLKEVRLYFRGRRQAEVAVIDMNHYMRRSTPMPLMLHAGDAIYVPRANSKTVASYLLEYSRYLIPSMVSFILFRAYR